MKFETHQSVIYSANVGESITGVKLACFDLDGTIIRPKSGKIYPTDPTDWMFFNDNIKSKLYEYYNSGYKLVIFTNQSGMTKGYTGEEQFLEKINAIHKELNLDFEIFIAKADDYYRKPKTGMWDFLLQLHSSIPDVKHSFYCGDMAGRKGDRDNTDRYFANNVGLKFEIPENMFRGENEKTIKYQSTDKNYDGFDPKMILHFAKEIPAEAKKEKDVDEKGKEKGNLEVILLMGPPASGKTQYSHRGEFKKYRRISRDVCGTPAKCLVVMEKALKAGENIIVDNTNPKKEGREMYIDLARKYGARVAVYQMDIDKRLARHLNHYRVQRKHAEAPIPEVAYRTYYKYYEEVDPQGEGIDQVIKIPFVFKGGREDKRQFLYRYVF